MRVNSGTSSTPRGPVPGARTDRSLNTGTVQHSFFSSVCVPSLTQKTEEEMGACTSGSSACTGWTTRRCWRQCSWWWRASGVNSACLCHPRCVSVVTHVNCNLLARSRNILVLTREEPTAGQWSTCPVVSPDDHSVHSQGLQQVLLVFSSLSGLLACV